MQLDRDRGCGEHGGVGAHSDADEQGDGEVGERVAAEYRERAQDEPAGHDAGEREHDGDRGDGQPAAPVPHQVRVPRGKPAADPAEIRYPADLRTAPYRPPVHHPLRQNPGDDQGADHGGEHADGQRDTEPADRPGRKEEKKPGGKQGGDVRVGDRAERVAEAGRQRGPEASAAAGAIFLPRTLEHQNVGVHGHADGENETGEAGQGQGGAEGEQSRVGDEPVTGQRHGGDRAKQPVHNEDE